jgi:hypothetical protein
MTAVTAQTPDLAQALKDLTGLDANTRAAAFDAIIARDSRSWFCPDDPIPTSAYYEVSLHGVFVTGVTREYLVSNWIKRARDILDVAQLEAAGAL